MEWLAFHAPFVSHMLYNQVKETGWLTLDTHMHFVETRKFRTSQFEWFLIIIQAGKDCKLPSINHCLRYI